MAKRKKRVVISKKKNDDLQTAQDDEEEPSAKKVAASSTSYTEDDASQNSGFDCAGASETSVGFLSHFWCNFCEFSAETKPELIRHMRQHMIKCTHCPFSSLSKAEVARHEKCEHEDEMEVGSSSSVADHDMDKDPCCACIFCDFLTYSTEYLEKHTVSKHQGMLPKSAAKMVSKIVSAKVRKADALFYSALSNKHSDGSGLESDSEVSKREMPSSSDTILIDGGTGIEEKNLKDVKPPVKDLNNLASLKDNNMIKPDPMEKELCDKVFQKLEQLTSESALETAHELKVKVETMYCMSCSYNNVSVEKLKCHTFSQHPSGVAIAKNNSGDASLDLSDVTFFCVKETCDHSTNALTDYEDHIMSCFPLHITVSLEIKNRLKAILDFLSDFHKKHSQIAAPGFTCFISSFYKINDFVDPSLEVIPSNSSSTRDAVGDAWNNTTHQMNNAKNSSLQSSLPTPSSLSLPDNDISFPNNEQPNQTGLYAGNNQSTQPPAPLHHQTDPIRIPGLFSNGDGMNSGMSNIFPAPQNAPLTQEKTFALHPQNSTMFHNNTQQQQQASLASQAPPNQTPVLSYNNQVTGQNQSQVQSNPQASSFVPQRQETVHAPPQEQLSPVMANNQFGMTPQSQCNYPPPSSQFAPQPVPSNLAQTAYSQGYTQSLSQPQSVNAGPASIFNQSHALEHGANAINVSSNMQHPSANANPNFMTEQVQPPMQNSVAPNSIAAPFVSNDPVNNVEQNPPFNTSTFPASVASSAAYFDPHSFQSSNSATVGNNTPLAMNPPKMLDLLSDSYSVLLDDEPEINPTFSDLVQLSGDLHQPSMGPNLSSTANINHDPLNSSVMHLSQNPNPNADAAHLASGSQAMQGRATYSSSSVQYSSQQPVMSSVMHPTQLVNTGTTMTHHPEIQNTAHPQQVPIPNSSSGYQSVAMSQPMPTNIVSEPDVASYPNNSQINSSYVMTSTSQFGVANNSPLTSIQQMSMLSHGLTSTYSQPETLPAMFSSPSTAQATGNPSSIPSTAQGQQHTSNFVSSQYLVDNQQTGIHDQSAGNLSHNMPTLTQALNPAAQPLQSLPGNQSVQNETVPNFLVPTSQTQSDLSSNEDNSVFAIDPHSTHGPAMQQQQQQQQQQQMPPNHPMISNNNDVTPVKNPANNPAFKNIAAGNSPLSPSIYLNGQAPRHNRSNWAPSNMSPRIPDPSLMRPRVPGPVNFPRPSNVRQNLFAQNQMRGRGRPRGSRMPYRPVINNTKPSDDDVIVTAIVRGPAPPQTQMRGSPANRRGAWRGQRLPMPRGAPRGGMRGGPRNPTGINQIRKPFDVSNHFVDIACVVNAGTDDIEDDEIQIMGVTPGTSPASKTQPKVVDAKKFSYCCVHCGQDQGSKQVMKQHMKSNHNDSILGAFRNIENGQLLFFCPQLRCEFMTYDETRLSDHLYACYNLDKSKQLPFDLQSALKNLSSLKIRQVQTTSTTGGGTQSNPIELDGQQGLRDTFTNNLTDAFDDMVENTMGRTMTKPSATAGNVPNTLPNGSPRMPAVRGNIRPPRGQMGGRHPRMQRPPFQPRQPMRYGAPRMPPNSPGYRMRGNSRPPLRGYQPRPMLPGRGGPGTRMNRPPYGPRGGHQHPNPRAMAPNPLQSFGNEGQPIVIDLDADSPEAPQPAQNPPVSSTGYQLSAKDSSNLSSTGTNEAQSLMTNSAVAPTALADNGNAIIPQNNPWNPSSSAPAPQSFSPANQPIQQTSQQQVESFTTPQQIHPPPSDYHGAPVIGDQIQPNTAGSSVPNQVEGNGSASEVSDEEKIHAILLEKVFAKVPQMPKKLSQRLVLRFKEFANKRGVIITPNSKVIDEFVERISYKGSRQQQEEQQQQQQQHEQQQQHQQQQQHHQQLSPSVSNNQPSQQFHQQRPHSMPPQQQSSMRNNSSMDNTPHSNSESPSDDQVGNDNDIVETKTILPEKHLKFSGVFASMAESVVGQNRLNDALPGNKMSHSYNSGNSNSTNTNTSHGFYSGHSVSSSQTALSVPETASSFGSQGMRVSNSLASYSDHISISEKTMKKEVLPMSFPSSEEGESILINSSVDHIVSGHDGLEVDIAGRPVDSSMYADETVAGGDGRSAKLFSPCEQDNPSITADNKIKRKTKLPSDVNPNMIEKSTGKLILKVKKGMIKRKRNLSGDLSQQSHNLENKAEHIVRRSDRKRKVLHNNMDEDSLNELDDMISDDDDEYQVGSDDEDSEYENERSHSHSSKKKSKFSSEDPDAFNPKKGSYVCGVCLSKLSLCFGAKRHILKKHKDKPLYVLYGLPPDEEDQLSDPRLQILMYCPKDCCYATLKPEALSCHIAKCESSELPGYEGKDYNQIMNDFLTQSYPMVLESIQTGEMTEAIKEKSKSKPKSKPKSRHSSGQSSGSGSNDNRPRQTGSTQSQMMMDNYPTHPTTLNSTPVSTPVNALPDPASEVTPPPTADTTDTTSQSHIVYSSSYNTSTNDTVTPVNVKQEEYSMSM